MPTLKREIGDKAEQQAEKFLCQQGYRLRQRNFLCKHGEVDLLMQSPEGDIVFVEVRYRKDNDFGGAVQSITPSKQKKLRRTAQFYLQQHKLSDVPCRFDVIAITGQSTQWIQDAF
jgi:putative endonuclease